MQKDIQTFRTLSRSSQSTTRVESESWHFAKQLLFFFLQLNFIMERLLFRQELIVSEFSCRYQGRTSPFAWDSLLHSISVYSESCESVIERLQRKKSLPTDQEVNLASLMLDLHQKLMKVIGNDPFPVCSNYKEFAENWLEKQFNAVVTSEEKTDVNKAIQEPRFVYKTYQVNSSNLTVTCL